LPGVTRIEGGVRVSDAALEVIGPDLSEFEREVLADGDLLFEEYEEAFLLSERCTTDLGLTIYDRRAPSFIDVGSYGAQASHALDLATEDAVSRCKLDYTTDLSLIWGQIYHPTQGDIEASRREMAKCLNERGAGLPDVPSPQDFSAFLRNSSNLQLFSECARSVEARTGFRLR
jgi:hypothetical protein